MKKYVVVCGEFDSEQEAQVYAKLLGAWNIKCTVQEQQADQSQNLTEALMLIAEQLQHSNNLQEEMMESVRQNRMVRAFNNQNAPKDEPTPVSNQKIFDQDEETGYVYTARSSTREKAEAIVDKMMGQPLKPSLGSLLKSHRIAKKMTQKQVAEKAGVAMETICKYETGKPIRKSILLKLLEPLDIPMSKIQPYLNDFKGDVYYA